MPWLGSLVVSSEYQNIGIGSLLIQTTIDKAQRMGFEKLYLFAFDKTAHSNNNCNLLKFVS